MRKVLLIAAALAMLGFAVAPANAQKIDKNGRRHENKGKMAQRAKCAA